MSFRYPICFFLFEILVLALLLWVWTRRGRNVVVPFDHGVQSSGRKRRILLKLADSLKVLLLGVVIAILCGPTKLGQPETRRKVTNIEFCVDISGSMTASFGEGSRYDASMQAINEFLDYREGDSFGLTFFGTDVMHFVPLTTDPSAIKCAPPYMRPENRMPFGGGTEIGKALLACRRKLNRAEEGDRMIILVSDGQSADLGGGKDIEVARKLKEDKIVLYGIHIAESSVPDQIINITSTTGGEIFNPGDVEGLKTIFRRIDDMQRPQMEMTAAEIIDDYSLYSIIGLSLLGLTTCCAFGLRLTPW